ncbi:hypothetical protein EVAR_102909_1 [Eumeta japonica]|uniref:Uncharacterized protein n=1 Tax=Eumeta variegata TaxID=151549 RepID=A0A4C1ZK68_EUMVA|nr:hypothetical protein EVAR_102909_1 [Eumeta japonica]
MRINCGNGKELENGARMENECRDGIKTERVTETGVEIDISRYRKWKNLLYTHASGVAGINCMGKPPTQDREEQLFFSVGITWQLPGQRGRTVTMRVTLLLVTEVVEILHSNKTHLWRAVGLAPSLYA